MSNRNIEGDIIANKLSLVEAKGQKFLASLLGPQPTQPAKAPSSILQTQNGDEDLKEDYGHDRLGVGGILPKDNENMRFTNRITTSNDKLLAQLIGNKRAKAHMSATQEAARPNAKTQRPRKFVAAKKEESEEEEEGRAATFKSKRRKTARPAKKVESDGEEGERDDALIKPAEPKKKAEDEEPKTTKRMPNRQKTKPKSYLDEILAERSKKNNNKSRNKAAVVT